MARDADFSPPENGPPTSFWRHDRGDIIQDLVNFTFDGNRIQVLLLERDINQVVTEIEIC